MPVRMKKRVKSNEFRFLIVIRTDNALPPAYASETDVMLVPSGWMDPSAGRRG